ncbi:MAG: GDSL-type esterase/lipase family protein [candidate division KSB1 bacterium]|nr:GDSL-type esterase/lipase family protein [candidate division KSB1 bacterium]
MRMTMLFFVFMVLTVIVHAQQRPSPAASSDWPPECRKIEIKSSIDGQPQPAYFYNAGGSAARPLIVSLHTWSNGYEQKDTLSQMCIERDYHYIHPHFRGPNNNPDACGSPLAIQDIDDAIAYVINNAEVDTAQIHVIGLSGGGYATLLAFMKSNYAIKSFSAWVPISDLVKWYHESKARGRKYAMDIEKSTVTWQQYEQGTFSFNKDEAVRRSPYYMQTPMSRKRSKLALYAGIHDGYEGSVPITQSLLFYNKVVRDFDIAETHALIPVRDMLEMTSMRNTLKPDKQTLGGRTIHYEKMYKDLVKVVIFEGGHEILPKVALDHVPARRILAVGDSNGKAETGWVNQLKKMRYNDFIYNTSISGNTIGFDNLGDQKLNTLRNINTYIEDAYEQLDGLDAILIMLGTNDCKAVFDERLHKVPEYMETLINCIKQHPLYKVSNPDIYLISPPPQGKDKIMREKYHGGAERIAWLYPRFKKIAEKTHCPFIDVYSRLRPVWDYYAADGIHPQTEAQRLIARIINKELKTKSPTKEKEWETRE